MIGIVGGGITGLALHHYLTERGVESVVFEASGEPGGVIRSTRAGGHVLDLGPQRTRLSPPVAELIETLGLEGEALEANDVPLYVYRDGKLRRVPFTAREAIATDLLSWRGKARALLEPLSGPPRAEETVEDFFSRTFGREVATALAGPLYAGIYASHPGEMYARHSLFRALRSHGVSNSLLLSAVKAKLRRRNPPAVGSFVDGLQALPRALYERHRDRIRLESPVEAIRKDGNGFELETPNGTVSVEDVVLTTPADVSAALLESVTPEAATGLAELAYNPLAIVHLESDRSLEASGYKVQYDEDFRTLGVTCQSALFDREGVYACFLGGSRNPEVLEWSETRLGEVAGREFEAITGGAGRPIHVHKLSRGIPAYDRTWTALEDLETPSGIHLCANYESRAGIPGRIGNARALANRLADSLGPGVKAEA